MRRLSGALGVVAVAVALTVFVAFAVPLAWPGDASSPGSTTSPSPVAGSAAAPVAAASGPLPVAASPSAAPPAASAGIASNLVQVAIVPVTNFRATATSTNLGEVRSILAGTSGRYQALELVASEADPILAALGVSGQPSPDGSSWPRTRLPSRPT